MIIYNIHVCYMENVLYDAETYMYMPSCTGTYNFILTYINVLFLKHDLI